MVPREPTEAMTRAFRDARPDTAVEAEDGGWAAPATDWFRAQYAAMISATQQSPISGEGAAIGRNITFSPHDDETGNAVISPDYPDGPYWTLIGQGGDDRQNAVAAEICRRLNAAPPVPSVSGGEDQGPSLRDTQPGSAGGSSSNEGAA